MKNLYKIVLVVLVLVIVSVVVVWKYVNKPARDFSEKKEAARFEARVLLQKTEQDTASLSGLRDKLLAVNGTVKKVNREQTSLTLELGDTTTMSSIICQVDPRHIGAFESIKIGDPVSIKGIMTGYTVDTDLGLGNTIEMNFCTKN